MNKKKQNNLNCTHLKNRTIQIARANTRTNGFTAEPCHKYEKHSKLRTIKTQEQIQEQNHLEQKNVMGSTLQVQGLPRRCSEAKIPTKK